MKEFYDHPIFADMPEMHMPTNEKEQIASYKGTTLEFYDSPVYADIPEMCIFKRSKDRIKKAVDKWNEIVDLWVGVWSNTKHIH